MMIRPRPLSHGDAIAIVSPASIINPDYVEGARRTIEALGYVPVVMPHALGREGSYSGTEAERLADLRDALTDPRVRAIVCSRGGYGAVHLLESLAELLPEEDTKWIAGFSDISALHALMASKGVMSIHSSMARQLAEGPDSEAVRMLFGIMRGEAVTLRWDATPLAANHPGEATGTLRGGNMAVIEGLAGTPFDNYSPGMILFIEDVGEPIYKVERMLYRLRLSGVLSRLSGLIVGRFTEYSADRNYATMEAMIADMTSDLRIPVAFNAPVGHIGGENMPLLHGGTATMRVDESGATLSF